MRIKKAIMIAVCCVAGAFAQNIKVYAEENINRIEVITAMDENGNITEISNESGLVDVPMMYAQRAAVQLVNFNTKGNVVTEYTEVGTGTSGYTCGPYGADALYLGQNNGKVRFMLSGVIGEVNANEVQLVNLDAAQSVSYYTVSNGNLIHKITTNMNKAQYPSSLNNGPAPSYLQPNVKYYSYDGHYFYTYENFANMVSDYQNGTNQHAVNPTKPYYNYFQYLPFRTQTEYSGDALENVINKLVGEESKMYGLGNVFVDMQNTYGTNAVLVSGIAFNESAWGKSNICKTKNNLFGINAVDSSPGQSANYYTDVKVCVKDFTELYLSKRYLRAGYQYYFGGFLGNKASGMNVKYASDPYWGEKAANMAYRLDSENQSKDYAKYTIAIKDTNCFKHTSGLNVRNASNTSGAILYKAVSQSHYPAVVLGEENGFYKIQSDPVLTSDRKSIEKLYGEYSFNSMYAFVSKAYFTEVIKGYNSVSRDIPSIRYSTHVQNIGWQPEVRNGALAGTEGKSYRMEAVKIRVNTGEYSGGVKYSAHVQYDGWKPYVENGQIGGTEGQSKRIEAIKIELTGEIAQYYDVFYQVHVEKKGWLGWAKNGAPAGTEGGSLRLEAIRIKLVKKGSPAPESNGAAFILIAGSSEDEKSASVRYSAHVQKIGWQEEVKDGEVAGTEGESLRMEAVNLMLDLVNCSGGITYSPHVQYDGWKPFVSDGELGGTEGESKRIEAIKIKLTGEVAQYYDVYYRVHAQNYGWLGWAKNGEEAGTEGKSLRLEAIQVKLVKKGEQAPTSTKAPFYK